jgi:hypothetical protein
MAGIIGIACVGYGLFELDEAEPAPDARRP